MLPLALIQYGSRVLCVGCIAVSLPNCSSRTVSSSLPKVASTTQPQIASKPQEAVSAHAATEPGSPEAGVAGDTLEESPVDQLQFEGREGANVEQLFGAWKSDLLAIVKTEHDRGFGFDNYDEKGVSWEPHKAPPLEGSLPYNWSVRLALALHYFDGAAARDDRYLVLRREDGTTVIGPRYSESDDIGDAAPLVASRLAVITFRGEPVLVVVSLEIGDRPDPTRGDSRPGPNARYQVYQSGRVCRFEPTRFACRRKWFTVFKRRFVSAAERAAMRKAPKPELPVLEPSTGDLSEASEE